MVHCLFEQTGTFKKQFIQLGIPAKDYDIENRFGETDYVIDLMSQIEKGYNHESSIFDNIQSDDLIFAFFPCIYFCDAKTLYFKHVSINMVNKSLVEKVSMCINEELRRHDFFIKLMQLVHVAAERNIRLIIENPWAPSMHTYLQCNFPDPAIIDLDRSKRGDVFKKRTAYWFFNCEPTHGFTLQQTKHTKKVNNVCDKNKVVGKCDITRSTMTSDYARNFICDFVIGKSQPGISLDLFNYMQQN